jgi:hypothetical protein
VALTMGGILGLGYIRDVTRQEQVHRCSRRDAAIEPSARRSLGRLSLRKGLREGLTPIAAQRLQVGTLRGDHRLIARFPVIGITL